MSRRCRKRSLSDVPVRSRRHAVTLMADVVHEVVQACGQRGDNPRQLLDNVPDMLGSRSPTDVARAGRHQNWAGRAVGDGRHRWPRFEPRRLEEPRVPPAAGEGNCRGTLCRQVCRGCSGGSRWTSASAPWATGGVGRPAAAGQVGGGGGLRAGDFSPRSGLSGQLPIRVTATPRRPHREPRHGLNARPTRRSHPSPRLHRPSDSRRSHIRRNESGGTHLHLCQGARVPAVGRGPRRRRGGSHICCPDLVPRLSEWSPPPRRWQRRGGDA